MSRLPYSHTLPAEHDPPSARPLHGWRPAIRRTRMRAASMPAVVVAGALLLAAPALAQRPVEPTTPGPAPGGLPAEGPAPAATPSPAPAATPAPAPQPPAQAPASAAPAGGVELAVKTVGMVRGRISVPLRCAASGTLALRTAGGVRVGAAPFECRQNVAVADVKVSRAAARRIARRRSVALRADIAMGGRRYVARLTLRTSARARAAAGGTWSSGSALCGSRFNIMRPGYYVQPPNLNSLTAGYDWVWYKPWLLWYSNGRYQWEEGSWSDAVSAPPFGQGATWVSPYMIGNFDHLHGWYVATALQLFWNTGRRTDWNWLRGESLDFGFSVVNGYWCQIP